MASAVASRGAAAIVGALVGDAASLGTHWIYARDAVEKAIGGPLGSGGEFLPPVPSYHKARAAGQTTMYGEGLLIMARSLAATGSVFSEADFLARWKASFGLCGSFTGYADHTTRTTLYKMMRTAAENEAATAPPKSAPEALRGKLFFAVKTAAEQLSGKALAERAAAVAVDMGAPDAAPWAVAAAAAWDAILRTPVASDDIESNTLGKLVPAAVAAAGKPDFAERVTRAIAVTQNAPDVTGYFVPLARAIEAAVLGTATTPRGAIDASLPFFDATRGARVREALAAADAGEDTWAALARFGASCNVANTTPMVAFILARYGADGFEAAIRHNMVGDSAARACVIGAVMGSLHGVPETWLARVHEGTREEARTLAVAVAGGGAGV